jgi:hypothetical protein
MHIRLLKPEESEDDVKPVVLRTHYPVITVTAYGRIWPYDFVLVEGTEAVRRGLCYASHMSIEGAHAGASFRCVDLREIHYTNSPLEDHPYETEL